MNDKEVFKLSQLLTRYVWKQLTTEEEAQLMEMLEKYSEREELIEALEDSADIKMRIERMENQDLNEAWNRVLRKESDNRQQDNKQKFFKKKWLLYAAAAILVGAVIGVLSNRTEPDQGILEESKYGYANDVLPGKSQATLTLSTGRTVKLGEEYQEINDGNGALAVGNHEELSYTISDKPKGKPIYNILNVPKSGFFRLTLPDGSKVWVNSLSELKFPIAFSSTERKVFIKGEAYFEVEKDLNRPFKVTVDENKEVVVSGTSFNVNTYRRRFITTLVEGSVNIKNGKIENTLSPGQQADASDAFIRIQPIDIDPFIAWKDGYFYFKRDKIRVVLDELARWYDLELRYVGEIPDYRLSGSIKRDVNLSEVLEMLKDVSSLQFEVDGKTLIIKETKS